jgi:ppGpp synthetase/RelA/SpoT-type nucleotidyltranferase
VALNPTIEAYVTSYKQRYDYFLRVAELCYERCRKVLQQSGILHLATFRAKDEERLREKLYQRAQKFKTKYETADDVERDVVDLAGVRIALYFPAQMDDAVRILCDQGEVFRVEETIPFPKQERRRGSEIYKYHFAGYEATHLRAIINGDALSPASQRFAGARVEIQVASVFMQAWAEVEHDLVYKPLRGELSVDEYSWLDQVNGLALAGNVALAQLQRTMNTRIAQEDRQFASHYELALFIHSRWPGGVGDEALMGRVDKLLAFLARFQLDRPKTLQPLLEVADASTHDTLVERLAERIIASDPSRAAERRRVWKEVEESATPNPYVDADTISRDARIFTTQQSLQKKWTTLDTAVRQILTQAEPGTSVRPFTWLSPRTLQKTLGFTKQTGHAIIAARQTHTRLSSGSWNGDAEELEEHEGTLRNAIEQLYADFPDFLNPRETDA